MDNKTSRNKYNILRNLSPTQILVLGFGFIILLGSIFLSMPISLQNGYFLSAIDALFTATSCVCVTGLFTINILDMFTTFGQVIILILVQVGGIGFMTFVTIIITLIGKKIGYRERLLIQESYNQNHTAGVIKMTISIILYTLIIEFIGAVLLSVKFIPMYGMGRGVYYSIFHSISAFCNAGITIIGDASINVFLSSPLVNIVLICLVFLGGLGFYVIKDIYEKFKIGHKEKHSIRYIISKLSLHTKLVVTTSILLIFIGTIMLFMVESFNLNTIGNLPTGLKLLSSFFHSVMSRTAGFSTINIANMTEAGKLVLMILMVIGGSPASTAGGIKTIAIAVLLLSIFSIIDGSDNTVVFNKSIPLLAIKRSLAVFFLGIVTIIVATSLICISEEVSLSNALFETTSAFSTTGFSIGTTAHLSFFGKIIFICTMFLGRLGTVTVAMSLVARQNSIKKNIISYPEEKIIIS